MRERAGDLHSPRRQRTRGACLALVVGLCTAAVPGKVSDPVAILAQVRHDWSAGKLERALDRLAVLEESDLADHVALIRARILREQGRTEESIAAARHGLQRNPPSEVASRLHYEIARQRLAEGVLLEAYREQRRAWESSRDPENSAALMMEFARAFDARQLPGDALRLYREVWQTWPLSEVGDAAYDRSVEIAGATAAPEPMARTLLDYAQRLRESIRCEQALKSYQEVLGRASLDEEIRREAERGRAQCLFSQRRYPEAATAYAALATADTEDLDAAFRVARSLARSGQTTRAVQQFDKVAKSGDRSWRVRAEYLTGIMLQETQPARAHELFRRVEKQNVLPDLARAARWELAWENLMRGEHRIAFKRLAPLARGDMWNIEVQRARYWRAMAQLELDAESGRRDLRSIAGSLPLSYYGLAASDRLGERPRLEHSFVGQRRAEAQLRHADRARWLLEAGFPDLATDELQSWLRARPPLSRESSLTAARLLHALGDHFAAVRTVVNGFGGALEQGIDPVWREAWRLAWPRPFDTPVRRASAEFESDPALIYAVMREESTYRPRAASAAGAMGLMQIIPETGDRIASSLGVPGFQADILLEPDTNIRFGTFYLKRLIGRFRGSEVLAIAAYNAGPSVVTRWLKRDGRLAQDVFVESVPYGETRRYVRRVVRSQRVYRLLYDGRP